MGTHALPITALLLFTTPALALDSAGHSHASNSGDLEELLTEKGLSEEGLRQAADNHDTYVLRKLLSEDFAQTPSLDKVLDERSTTPHLRGLLRPQASRSWETDVHHSTMMARLRPTPSHGGSNVEGVEFDIPLADHALVDQWIEYFSGRGRWHFAKWLARADRYAPIMQPILEEYGLPRDTLYLSMIESGFSAKAYSIAAASGFWQFIQSTGRLYGLRNDNWVDERRDFVMATHSAARFLRDLHAEFGHWHLAWAGYNAGGGRIRRALKKYGVRDFWTLISHKRSLAEETRHYVPKIIAAAIVAKNREKYGFAEVKPLSPLGWDEIKVADATDIRVIARRMKVSVEELRTLNPAFRHDISPPGRGYTIRVPEGRGDEVATWLKDLPKSKRLTYKQYVVQGGDTLHHIANRHGTTMTLVKEFNRVRNPHLLRPGQKLIIPSLKGSSSSRTVARRSTSSTKSGSSSRTKSARKSPKAKHTVARGETLWSIARRYGVSVGHLKKWNSRRSNVIGVGEVLQIF